MNKAKVGIILASDSDIPIMGETKKVLEEFGVPFEVTITSAHRSPERTIKVVEDFYDKGIKVIIASAGLAAHLAGSIAAHFPLPVIGVPVTSGALKGMDALLATVQMPPGIPVATVAIDGAKNAGLLAIQILATSDKNLEKKIVNFKKELAVGVGKKAERLDKLGIDKYNG